MSTHTMTVILGDDEMIVPREYKVRYSYTPARPAKISGPPEHCYPAEAAEVSIVNCKPDPADWNNEWLARMVYEDIENYIHEHHEDAYEAERDAYLEDKADEARHERRQP